MVKKVTIEVNPLWEAIKYPLRLLVLAIIPFLIAYLTELPYEWAAILTAVLSFIDKILHEVGKAENNETLTKGLTQF